MVADAGTPVAWEGVAEVVGFVVGVGEAFCSGIGVSSNAGMAVGVGVAVYITKLACPGADELPLPIATLTHKPSSSTAVNAAPIRLSFPLRVLNRYQCQGVCGCRFMCLCFRHCV